MVQEPQGFHLEVDGGIYSCVICHASISGLTGWWDLNGQKCLSCQKAIESGIIPAYICTNRDSWYSTYELVRKFKITSSIINRLQKEGKLKSRKIRASSGPTSFEIYIKQENQILDTFPLN